MNEEISVSDEESRKRWQENNQAAPLEVINICN